MPDHQSHLPVRDVDAPTADRLIAEGATVLDVREPYEWADAHIEGSVLIPLGRLQVGSVPSGRPVVVVCRSGRRSAVRRSASARRQRAMAPWLPPLRRSGMLRPSQSRGRV